MAKLATYNYSYQGKDYKVAEVPDVFSLDNNRTIKIGSHSLSFALFKEETGYIDDEARIIDEEIYAYLDDSLFNQDLEAFLSIVKLQLD